jgi:tRNA A37 threonylcarbamoyladenosine modification protein TsaB
MILSCCLRENELHVLAGEISKIHHIDNVRDIADIAPMLIHNTIAENSIQDVSKIVYPVGPGSFTAIRTMSSIAIGFSIANPIIEIIGVSSFSAYSFVAEKISRDYVIAIPTMRGDFFVYESSKSALENYDITNTENIPQNSGAVFYPNSEIFTNVNLAVAQIHAHDIQHHNMECFT